MIEGRKVPENKLKEVAKLAKQLSEAKTVAVIDMHGLPAKQAGKIRSKIRNNATIIMTKKSILVRALKEANKAGVDKLAEVVKGMPALIFSELNPFELFSLIKANRSPAKAKVGQIAPEDVIIEAGPTPFTPGPIVSQLSGLKIKAAIENGKVVIKAAATVLKKGETFTPAAVDIASKMGMEPMRIGINLIAALEDNQIYLADVLDISIDRYIADIKSAHSDAFKLAIERSILNSDTAIFLITKAESDAEKLAVGAEILNTFTAPILLAKAENQAKSLKASLPEKFEAVPEPVAEEASTGEQK